MRTIFFDLDGTIADLYGVKNWLQYLLASNPFPYENAKPLLNLQALARVLNRLQRNGFRIEVISWLSKNSTPEYDEAVTLAKLRWLRVHLASVSFDEINIVSYGICKDTFRHTTADILFDDEKPNREAWNGVAFGVENIIETLRSL
jgi:hypothetical protein